MTIKDQKDAWRSLGFGVGSPRSKHDFYCTPPEAVYGLLSKERFGGTIWEPACGNGAISIMLEAIMPYCNIISTDRYYHGFGETGPEWDFLTCSIPHKAIHIITNPPFELSTEFIVRGTQIIDKIGGKLCLFGRLLWLEGQKRGKLFTDTPLARIWVFSARLPRMHIPGYVGKKTTSTMAFAWYVWEKGYVGLPTIGWISKEEMNGAPL